MTLTGNRPRPDLTRWLPPGYPPERDEAVYALAYMATVLCSLGLYFMHYGAAYGDLFRHVDGEKVLLPGAVMPDFAALLPGVFGSFLLMAAVTAVLAALHYQYFYQGGRSIYLMRRLPDRWELPRRCLALPLAGAVFALATLVLLFFLFFAHYMLKTPPEALSPHQWQKIWSVIP